MTPIRFDRLILHPGSPKTGTSTLQNFLYRKRGLLGAQGYHYPLAGIDQDSGNAKGHHALALALGAFTARSDATTERAFLDQLEALRAEIEAHAGKTIILSSEELFGARRMSVLKRCLEPQQCLIYVSLRPQYDVLNATYYTSVTHHRITEAPETYYQNSVSHMMYRRNLTEFAQFAPRTEVSLRIFERGHAVRDNPIRDFLSVTGLDLKDGPEDNIVEHPTLPAAPTLFLRWLNEAGVGQADFYEIFQALHRMRPSLPKEVRTMSPGRMRALVQMFEEDNIWLRQTFGDGAARSIFQAPVYSDPEKWEQEVGSDHLKAQQAFLKLLCTRAEGGAPPPAGSGAPTLSG